MFKRPKPSFSLSTWKTLILITILFIVLVTSWNLITYFLEEGLEYDTDGASENVWLQLIPQYARLANEPDLRIIVLAFDRTESLQRLLESLSKAQYGNDLIALDIWIDKPDDAPLHQDVYELAKNFQWQYGLKTVHAREANVGLAHQWLETWNDSIPGGLKETTAEKVIILEDDLEVSQYYWTWLKAAYANYGDRPDIAGFTLQRANLCAKFCKDLHGGPVRQGAFFSLLLGSWGFSPTARHWVRFRAWITEFQQSGEKPYIEGLRVTEWYKRAEAEGRCPGKRCMWTMHHLKYVDTHEDKYTVYVKCNNQRTLASNSRPAGLHFKEAAGKDFEPLEEWDEALDIFPTNPVKIGWNGRRMYKSRLVDVPERSYPLLLIVVVFVASLFIIILFVLSIPVSVVKPK